MLRAQTLVTLKEYHSALFDVNRLIELNPSSEVYQNLHARLKTQLSLAPIPEAEELEEDEDEDDDLKVDWEGQCTNKETNEIDLGEDNRDVMEATTRKAESGSVKQTAKVSDVQKIESSEQQSSSWEAIPQPKGHSRLDYSRWDRVEDDSSGDEDDDDDDDSQPQYRFRVKTIGVRAVK
ncbi:unnamed protein product [Withania somnifera]